MLIPNYMFCPNLREYKMITSSVMEMLVMTNIQNYSAL